MLRRGWATTLSPRVIPSAAIALRLNNSEITIKQHRGKVMQKMLAESLADLVRMAERLAVLI